MPKHPETTAEPIHEDGPQRLTPSEIDSLRADAHQMGAEMRAWLAARKKQTTEE
jgi:hypothetical protein